MEKARCYLKCAETKLEYINENGDFKILNNITQNFQVKILNVFPLEKSKDDYEVGFELEHLLTKDIRTTNLNAIKEYYFINHS